MQKTTNYQLNQWVKSDRIQMEDFNSDNAKIDAALKALEDAQTVVKLLDMTTTEVLSEVTLDLSGIDLTRYHKLDIWLMPNLSGIGGSSTTCYLGSSGDASGSDESTLRVSQITPDQLTSLRLTIEPTGNSTAPAQMEIGSTLQIYGLKK